MKKVMYVFFALCLAITFVSCEGPEGPMGPAGRPGEPGEGTHWEVVKIIINKSDWQLVGNPNDLHSYYKAEMNVPELVEYFYNWGNVNGYIEFGGDDDGINKKFPLPYTSHNAKIVDLEEYRWTETYDFSFKPQKVTFYVTYSDFYTGDKSPETETFYLVLTR